MDKINDGGKNDIKFTITEKLTRYEGVLLPKKWLKCFWGAQQCWCMRLTTSPPSVMQMSRHCGILSISEPYRSPEPVTWIALFYLIYLFYLLLFRLMILT
jgi:hypothetical protein